MSTIDLLLTIDTEEDDEWAPRPSTTCENLRFVPRFQELCERHGFPVTYLLTHGAANSPHAPGVFGPPLERATCEVGAHLHPWNTPPELPQVEADGSFPRPFPLEYPPERHFELLERTTGAIERCLGVRPRSYRAGRYGLDAAGASALRALGYDVDCSVTPGLSWRRTRGRPGGPGGPDFTTAPAHPYWMAEDRVDRPGSTDLLEVPVTVVHTRRPFRGDHALTRAWSRVTRDGLPARVARRCGLARRWLRPFPKYSTADLLAVCRSARAAGAPVLEMILHSSELMPGCSPYRKDSASIEALYSTLDGLFAVLAREGVRGNTLSGFRQDFAARHPSPASLSRTSRERSSSTPRHDSSAGTAGTAAP